MFNNKEYFEVNREERHYGNLLISSIIYDDNFRKHFFELINSKLRINDYLKGNFDIYSETAIFRDYWHDLGDQNKWNNELLIRRKKIIELFFNHFNIDLKIIEKYPIFWTGKINDSKLWSPGNWTKTNNLKILKNIEIENSIENSNLCRIGWAFNAKPDLLIISNNNCIIIELKLESGVGSNDHGYNQIQTQQDIIDLIKVSIPYFENYTFKNIMIAKESEEYCISWTELVQYFNNDLVKKHFSNIIKKY